TRGYLCPSVPVSFGVHSIPPRIQPLHNECVGTTTWSHHVLRASKHPPDRVRWRRIGIFSFAHSGFHIRPNLGVLAVDHLDRVSNSSLPSAIAHGTKVVQGEK